jgi:RNA polymerase sigma-70 factor (ECF subfamily)
LRKSSKLVSLEGMSEMTEIETDQRTDYSDLYRAVNSLKEELRMPVILYYIEDFNIKEIAQILEITEGAVQKRLARARGKLKRNLQESEELTV